MRWSSKRARKYKTGDYLFQLTRFWPGAPRDMCLMSYQNFEASYGLVLDFDGGSVSPAEFIRIFWLEAGSRTKHAFIIANTFSTSPDKPNKFRVVLPFNGVVHSIEEFVAINETIVQRLAEHGHTPGRSGLDRQSGVAVHSWYLPIQPGAYAHFTAGHEAKQWLRRHCWPIREPENYNPAMAEHACGLLA
jgi:hypothetical protein